MDEELWTGMVDIGYKPVVAREAVETGMIVMYETAIEVVANGR